MRICNVYKGDSSSFSINYLMVINKSAPTASVQKTNSDDVRMSGCETDMS